MAPIQEVEAQRRLWRRERQRERLEDPTAEDFAIGGLATVAGAPGLRVVCLPADPEADLVPLDGETVQWLLDDRTSPHGGSVLDWGRRTTATTNALIRYDQYGDDAPWDRYLALNRSGGVEAGYNDASYEIRETKVFALRLIIGVVWTVVDLQREAFTRWNVPGPWELCVALREVEGATLGNFAEGWAELGHGLYHFNRAIGRHGLIRIAVDDAADAQDLALEVGARLELTFGSVGRRYLAQRGDFEGRFDPRFGF